MAKDRKRSSAKKKSSVRKKPSEHTLLKTRNVYLILVVAGILLRIPLFGIFDMVTYDGTYYINDARSILGEPYPLSAFPFGYPALIALLIPIFRDGVLAARMVSMIAGIVLPLIIFELARDYVKKREALIAALIIMLVPLCVKMSMITMSESIYVFWLFMGLLLFSRGRELFSGLFMGLAAATRPEAIGVFGVLALLRLRRSRRLLLILAGFTVVYSISIAAQSWKAGELVLITKIKSFGYHAEDWVEREQIVDQLKNEDSDRGPVSIDRIKNLVADYVKTVPGELMLVVRHFTGILFLLALYGIYRKRFFLLTSFVPFLIYPFFTLRREARMIFPYIPALALYAVIGLSSISKQRTRSIFYVLLSLSVISGLVINRGQLSRSTVPQWVREGGLMLAKDVRPRDRIADRKPYFAFYSGGIYVEIPLAPYNKVMDYLLEEDVEYLICNNKLIQKMRPALLGLLSDEVLKAGEFRYSPHFSGRGVFEVYKRNPEYKPLVRQELLKPERGNRFGLAWSPDGSKIAYGVLDPSGDWSIYTVSPENGRNDLVIKSKSLQGSFSWSPDSRAIACSMWKDDNLDVYIYHPTGRAECITSHEGNDVNPYWSRDGKEIVFVSSRSGGADIWVKNLESGELSRITKSGINDFPIISPDGSHIAWVRSGEGLIIYNRSNEIRKMAKIGRNVYFPPAWSPDGRYLMMTRSSWGTLNVCLMSSDGEHVLQLVGSDLDEGAPTWREDGKAVAVLTKHDKRTGVTIISGMDHYFDRIERMSMGRQSAPAAVHER